MINKKRLHFYQLSFIFSSIIIFSLLFNWGYKGDENKSESMMTKSMGKMMSLMHLENITLQDLVKGEVQNTNIANNLKAHHNEINSFKKDIYYITTVIIIVFIPIIIAGAVFLSIVWIK